MDISEVTAMLEWWECKDGYKMQLVLTHFEWIEDGEAEKMEKNSKESYNSLDENERERWE